MKQALGIGMILVGATAWHIAIMAHDKPVKNIKDVWQAATDTMRQGFVNK